MGVLILPDSLRIGAIEAWMPLNLEVQQEQENGSTVRKA